LTQEVANLVAIDTDADGIIDALNVKVVSGGISSSVTVVNTAVNPVPVTIIAGGGTGVPFVEFGTALSIPANSLTTVLTHTVGTAPLILTHFYASGELDATVSFYINTVRKLSWRTSEQQRNAEVDVGALQFAIGTILDIKIVHYYNGKTADFEASLVGYK
jgi:hypothetical protein